MILFLPLDSSQREADSGHSLCKFENLRSDSQYSHSGHSEAGHSDVQNSGADMGAETWALPV